MTNLLEVDGLKKHFPIHQGLLRKLVGHVKAVDGVSLAIGKGETLSLVGESGCGKTTVSRCIVRALRPSAGAVRLRIGDGPMLNVAQLSRRELNPVRPHVQMIFQDPFSSLNPRMTIGDIIAEPLLINDIGDAAARRMRVKELLDVVKLPAAYMNRFPHAFSGGQRQRIGIARALALNPSLVVADEPVSALDVSVQAQIVNLLLELQERLQLTYLFIAHDLSVVKHVSDRVAVMYVGRIVEEAPTEALFSCPRHPYTEALLSAVPKPDPRRRSQRVILTGEVADPANPPPGCAFHPRCRYATDLCKTETPNLAAIGPNHRVSCHHAANLSLSGV
jgi:oligopeptide/dipeptide ABC transporter ATP-binding protein